MEEHNCWIKKKLNTFFPKINQFKHIQCKFLKYIAHFKDHKNVQEIYWGQSDLIKQNKESDILTSKLLTIY